MIHIFATQNFATFAVVLTSLFMLYILALCLAAGKETPSVKTRRNEFTTESKAYETKEISEKIPENVSGNGEPSGGGTNENFQRPEKRIGKRFGIAGARYEVWRTRIERDEYYSNIVRLSSANEERFYFESAEELREGNLDFATAVRMMDCFNNLDVNYLYYLKRAE